MVSLELFEICCIIKLPEHVLSTGRGRGGMGCQGAEAAHQGCGTAAASAASRIRWAYVRK